MSQGKTRKTLVFKRCYTPEGTNISLQDILDNIKLNAPNHIDRTYKVDLLKEYIIADIDSDVTDPNNGRYIRLCCQDRGATGLIDLHSSEERASVDEYHAPDNRGWLENEMLLYVVNNNIIGCNVGSKDKFLGAMINRIAQTSKVTNDDFSMRISDVPNKTEISRINEIGVKEIDLSLTSYLASLDDLTSNQNLPAIIEGILGVPSNKKGLHKRSATSGRLKLTRGKFKPDEVKKDEWLTNIGEIIVEDNMNDYKILLDDGNTISSDTLKVSKPVNLNRYANSFSQAHAREELKQYYSELKDNGSLAW